MTDPANPPHDADDPGDLRALAGYASALVAAIDATIEAWAVRSITGRWEQWQGRASSEDVLALARSVAHTVRAEVVPALDDLLSADVDSQRTNPLSVLRSAVPHLTRALRELGVPGVDRDVHAERILPDDVYDLSPAAFADIDQSVHEPGLVWGAAKAHVILRRRKR